MLPVHYTLKCHYIIENQKEKSLFCGLFFAAWFMQRFQLQKINKMLNFMSLKVLCFISDNKLLFPSLE